MVTATILDANGLSDWKPLVADTTDDALGFLGLALWADHREAADEFAAVKAGI